MTSRKPRAPRRSRARDYDRRKYSLRRKYLDRGGYDERGEYYGSGEPLYVAENLRDAVAVEFRAPDRARAIARMKVLIREGKLEERRRPSGYWWGGRYRRAP